MIKLKVNGKEVDFVKSVFPDKTTQIWQLSPLSSFTHNKITWLWEDTSEIFDVFQLIDLIRTYNTEAYISLYLPYLPFARQDKYIDNSSTFALVSFARLLNSKNLNLIVSFDAHSNKAEEYINNFFSLSPTEFQLHAWRNFNTDVVFYPDKGAFNRYNLFTDSCVYGEKVRNQLTGKIESYDIVYVNNINLKDKRILIVDDIVDGGATFILAANHLKQLGVGDIGLCVSHGLFSAGYDKLNEAGITQFFTTNSLLKNKGSYKIWE